MSGSFSLAEKLAVAAAFCALVVMVVGTESDPGVIATSQTEPGKAIASARREVSAKSSSNYWSLSRGGGAPATSTAPAAPPPEILPPGFGATPSPDLPQ